MIEKQFNKRDIETYLEKINDELNKLGIKGNILIVGGAALSLLYESRDLTKDIDAVYEPKEIINDIVKKVSISEQIHSDWLNDSVKGFISPTMPQNLIKEYSHLSVYSVSADALLAMKLISARTASKDGEDAIVLMKRLKIHSEKQLYEIVEKYTHKDNQTPNSYYFIQSVYERYNNEVRKERKLRNDKPFKSQVWKQKWSKAFIYGL